MRYFTKALWAGGNSSNREAARRAARDWDANACAYQEQLTLLLPRLSKAAASFFTRRSLHDGTLISAYIGDAVGQSLEQALAPQTRRRTTVVLTVDDGGWPGYLYKLAYDDVKAFEVQADDSLFPVDRSLFGDWGYDELTGEADGYLRHSILFQTGSTLSIVFRRFRVSRLRIGRG